MNAPPKGVLVVGATGYIGRRLVPHLLAAGHKVRCLARTRSKLDAEPWLANVEVVSGDVLDRDTLAPALRDIGVAYYLVHSIGSESQWQARDRVAAENFRDAAAEAGLDQIIYLGGLGNSDSQRLSRHLASRQEVGRVLAEGPVPLTEIRAAMVIGSGSASFEMLRHLVEVLPVMTTPRWVETRVQPIAIHDILVYLTGVLGHRFAYGRIFEVGGADVLTYHEMMDLYATVAGLRRRIIVKVPVLSPRLSSLWVGLVTPIPTTLARPLIDGLVNEVVVNDHSIDTAVTHQPMGCREAIELALRHAGDFDESTTLLSDKPLNYPPADATPTDPTWARAVMFTDIQIVRAHTSPAALYREICSLGGKRGWLAGNWFWTIRGWLDRLVGGPGMRRGRLHPSKVHVGDIVDFWRVEALEAPHMLRLRAEMRVPGDAWLEWSITPDPEYHGVQLTQRAVFHPRGLGGRLYWYALSPFHRFIFRPLALRLAHRAEHIS